MTVLVERQRELNMLTSAVRTLQRNGRGTVALVSGEAGAGKTALIDAFLGSLPDGVRSTQGHCDPASITRPFAPLIDWLTELDGPGFGRSVSSDRGEAFRAALDLLADGIVDRIVAEHPDAADEPEDFCRRMSLVIAGELSRLTRTNPTSRLAARHAARGADRQGRRHRSESA
jgi:predicted ATPase